MAFITFREPPVIPIGKLPDLDDELRYLYNQLNILDGKFNMVSEPMLIDILVNERLLLLAKVSYLLKVKHQSLTITQPSQPSTPSGFTRFARLTASLGLCLKKNINK